MDKRDKDIEREAIRGEAWAAWKAAEQAVDERCRQLEEVILLLWEGSREAALLRDVFFLLEFEPDPEPD